VSRWDEILRTTRKFSVTAFAMLHQDAHPEAAGAGALRVQFRSPGLARTFSNRFLAALEEAASRVAGHSVQVQVVAGDEPARPASAPLATPAPPGGPVPAAVRVLSQAVPAPPGAQPPGAGPGGGTASRAGSSGGREPAAGAASEPPAVNGAGGRAEEGRRTASANGNRAEDLEDEPSPDDPDAGVRALTGVPLVVEMLGGTILEEIDET
jgi:DNA polymerase-3 subunit gamma/tau